MNIAVILAGGTGTRLGADLPKQYIEVAGKPIIAYCLQLLEAHPLIDAIQVVAEDSWQALVEKWSGMKLHGFSKPGRNRQLSILNALEDVRQYAAKDSIVLIHDAARPLVSEQTVTDCLNGCVIHDAVMPALPVKDTVYLGADGRIDDLLDRSKVLAGQAPEAFRLQKYYEANLALLPDRILGICGSTEPAILAGLDVKYIAGDERNFKITTKVDLERFQEIISGK